MSIASLLESTLAQALEQARAMKKPGQHRIPIENLFVRLVEGKRTGMVTMARMVEARREEARPNMTIGVLSWPTRL
jgi:hypothetical protein